MYCEEIDWARRFAERGWTILVAPSARLVHHGGSSTRQRAEAMRLALWESRARYLARWGTPRQRALIPRIVVLGMHPRMRRPTDDRRANDRAIVERFSRLVSVERR
jgi:GT2 family glycosyltransferase